MLIGRLLKFYCNSAIEIPKKVKPPRLNYLKKFKI